MVQLSPYAQVSAMGVKDILNQLAQQRTSREQEEKENFGNAPSRGSLVPQGNQEDRRFPNQSQKIGLYGGRDFYGSLRKLQDLQFKSAGLGSTSSSLIKGLGSNQGITGTKLKGGGKAPKGGFGGGVQGQVRSVANKYGWASGKEWQALVKLVQKESSWNPKAANPKSSARGLFQKMTSLHGAVEGTAAGQAQWGLKYIKQRYGSPSKALAFHLKNNWY